MTKCTTSLYLNFLLTYS
uniref:Uncharacterized protein n=1 Tax=Arundo donax TaxID=35708 RepID=A0A0A8ZL02_ARUDO